VFAITSCPGLNHTVTVTGGVREAPCRELLQGFFRAKRATAPPVSA
jgi:tRNA(Arg) A34 adenosine deaminase TadA